MIHDHHDQQELSSLIMAHPTFFRQTSNFKPQYHIAALDDAGEWEYLATFPTYEQADAHLDRWSNRYPHAHIDIVHGSLQKAS